MITWSLERLIYDATRLAKAVVAPMFTPPLDGWPRTDAYRASRDGAEELAAAEAEQEVWEPMTQNDCTEEEVVEPFGARYTLADVAEMREQLCNEPATKPLPVPEPELTSDELVVVRGLIQERCERYEDDLFREMRWLGVGVSTAAAGPTNSPADAATSGGYRTASAAGASPSADAGATPPAPSAEGPLTWEGWAVPAICDVLAAHTPHPGDGGPECSPEWNYPRPAAITPLDDFETPYSAEHLLHLSDWQAWREHVAPLIAERIACDPTRTMAALKTLKGTQPQ